MRAGGPGLDDALGEWHMHCHALAHMMGTLLIVPGGALALPTGVPCEHGAEHDGDGHHDGGAMEIRCGS